MDRRKPLKAQLIVVTSTSVLGGFGGFLLEKSGVAELIEGPFIEEETASAALLNSALLVALLVAGALLLLLLIRLRASLMKVVGAFSFSLLTFLVSDVYIYALDPRFTHAEAVAAALALASLYTILVRPQSRLTAGFQVVIGSLTGPIIASTVPMPSMVAMLAAVALYDIYAVYKGPLKRLLERFSGKETSMQSKPSAILVPYAVYLSGVVIGMGDVVFYSSMASLALLSPTLNVVRLLCVVAALYTGLSMTFRLLSRRRYAPALPLPILLSLLAYILFNLLIG